MRSVFSLYASSYFGLYDVPIYILASCQVYIGRRYQMPDRIVFS